MTGNCGEHLFRSLFNQKISAVSPTNQLWFISKHFRLKCDNCAKLCCFEFYIENSTNSQQKNELNLKESIIICLTCAQLKEFPSSIDKSCLVLSNLFSILSGDKSCKKIRSDIWEEDDVRRLVVLINKFGDNWDEIEQGLENKKTKIQIINKFLQLPIKERNNFKLLTPSTFDIKTNAFSNNINQEEQLVGEKNPIDKISDCSQDLSNPFMTQISFFMKMLNKFLNAEVEAKKAKEAGPSLESIKDTIYKSSSEMNKSKSDSVIKAELNPRMKMILDLLVYTQMKKIELKLDYFNEFDRIIEQEASQIKTLEAHIVQDRVKFAIRRIELNDQMEKLKLASSNGFNNIKTIGILHDISSGSRKNDENAQAPISAN